MQAAISLGFGFGAAIWSVVEMVWRYPSLPAMVPLHFDIRGRPNSRGPRWLAVTIFSAVLLALVCSLFATTAAGSREAVSVAIGLCFIAFVQHLVLDAAVRAGQFLDNRRFWSGLAAFLLAIVLLAR